MYIRTCGIYRYVVNAYSFGPTARRPYVTGRPELSDESHFLDNVAANTSTWIIRVAYRYDK